MAQSDFVVKNGLIVLNGVGVESTSTTTGALIIQSGGLAVGGNVNVSGTITAQGDIIANGNIILGNSTGSDTLILMSEIASDIIPKTDGVYNIGTQTLVWNTVWSKSLRLTGGVNSGNSQTGDLTVVGGIGMGGNLVSEGKIFVNAIIGNPLIPYKSIDTVAPWNIDNTGGDLLIRGYNAASGSNGPGGHVYISGGMADPEGQFGPTTRSGNIQIWGGYPGPGDTGGRGIDILGSPPPWEVGATDSALGKYVEIAAGNRNNTFIRGGAAWAATGDPNNSAGIKGGNLILEPGFNAFTATDINGLSTVGGIYIGSNWEGIGFQDSFEPRYATMISIGNAISTTTIYGPNAESSTTGALRVSGGVGILEDLYVGNKIYGKELYENGSRIVTQANLVDLGVTSIYAGTDTAVNTSTGSVTVWNNSTLDSITSRGSSTNQVISINNVTSSTSSTTGALIVAGGVGIQQDLYVGGNVYSLQGQPLYSPKVHIGDSPPTTATNNVGDFWIDTVFGVEYQWIKDGSNYYWIQFTGV